MKKYHIKTVKLIILFTLVLFIPTNNSVLAVNLANGCDKDKISNTRLSGYGTIGYTFNNSSDISPRRDFGQDPDKLFKNNGTWKLHSSLGLQADCRLSEKMELVIQGVFKDRFDPDILDTIESVYAGFRPLPQTDIRVGRLGYDAFLMSDIRNTGYAYLWVSPPSEFYSWLPIFSVDGVDAAYTIDQGDVYWRIKAQAGRSSLEMPMETSVYDFETEDLWTLSLSRQSGPLRIKAIYSQCTPLNEAGRFNTLHAGLEAVAAATALPFPDINSEALALRKNLYFKDNKVSYIAIGAAYDDGSWVAQAEVAHSTAKADVLPNGNMAYMSIGYRLGDFIPYFLFSTINPGGDRYKATSDWNLIGQEEFHSQALATLNITRIEQYTNSLGIRWDFNNQSALKLQWDNTHIKPSGYGLWQRDFEILGSSNTVNLWSFSMEFVF